MPNLGQKLWLDPPKSEIVLLKIYRKIRRYPSVSIPNTEKIVHRGLPRYIGSSSDAFLIFPNGVCRTRLTQIYRKAL